MADAIEVRGLVKQYDGLTAVDHVDFSVPPGTVFAFLGPNGAGKTTTVEILEGLRKRTSGEVRVLGLDPWSDGAELHRRIGVIPQDFRFFEKITPREGIEYYRALFDSRADPDALLRLVELEDKQHARYDQLSGGQKQKLGLALSLTNEPEVHFLDEPTTGLDPTARRAIWNVIRTLKQQGRTVFLTTHYLEEAELLSDRVAIIHHGKIIAAGTAAEIIAAHGRGTRLRFEAPPALAEYLSRSLGVAARSSPGLVEVDLEHPRDAVRVLTAAEESGLPWTTFSTAQDTLEDVFVRMVGTMDDGALKGEVPT
ncbi:MAG TPA: ABC transporter ATP-binding protein [Thermoplasmata archaeon]|nr:ABC transporter ATP-binding protein [Thermoplasmata archaeon]